MKSLEAEGDRPGQEDLSAQRLSGAGQQLLCRSRKAGLCPSALLSVSVSHILYPITPINPWMSVQNTRPCPRRGSFRDMNSTPFGVRDPLLGHLGPCGKATYTSYVSTGSFPFWWPCSLRVTPLGLRVRLGGRHSAREAIPAVTTARRQLYKHRTAVSSTVHSHIKPLLTGSTGPKRKQQVCACLRDPPTAKQI